MLKTIITPSEVVAIAFDQTEAVRPEIVTRAAILAAQRKFIKPALGVLYDQMLEGQHRDLLQEYVKTPLALYVKWAVMPALAVRSGNLGVVRTRSGNFTPAPDRALAQARKRLKADAGALMQCMTEHLAANPALYPGFERSALCPVRGGIVL